MVLLALVVPLTIFVATPAEASYESEFVSRMNGARASHGIRAYPVLGDLASVARRHAERMASQRRMYHNPNLGSEVGGWQRIGENVGRGSNVQVIHNAFMGSASHRANILSTSFTQVGVGVARASNGELFVSQVFRRPYGTTVAPPPPPPPPPARTTTAPRASRSAPRKPIVRVVPKKPARKRVVVDPTPRRLREAWRMYRTVRPADSLEHVVVFLRANTMIAD